MKLFGMGALGVWHGVKPGCEAEVERWYINEHYHDRVVIGGFLRARGYKNVTNTGSLYFSRYDVDNVSELGCKDYLHSLRNPSPWSQEIFKHYHHTVRGAFGVSSRWCIGAGGYLLSLRLDNGVKGVSPTVVDELEAVLPLLQKMEGVVAIEKWLVDKSMSTIKTTEQEIRGQQDKYPAGAILIDIMNKEIARTILSKLPETVDVASVDLMKLTYQLTKAELILPRPH